MYVISNYRVWIAIFRSFGKGGVRDDDERSRDQSIEFPEKSRFSVGAIHSPDTQNRAIL